MGEGLADCASFQCQADGVTEASHPTFCGSIANAGIRRHRGTLARGIERIYKADTGTLDVFDVSRGQSQTFNLRSRHEESIYNR